MFQYVHLMYQLSAINNKRHYLHFTPTFFGITVPFSGVHTKVKTIYSKMDLLQSMTQDVLNQQN